MRKISFFAFDKHLYIINYKIRLPHNVCLGKYYWLVAV